VPAAHPIFTIGHSTRSFDEFVGLLASAGVTVLADVRAFPMSRRYPHFNREALVENLPRAGIAYAHMPALGGRRKKQPGIDPVTNAAWENQSFHNYADYALGDDFAAALRRVRQLADTDTPAVCCAEAHWSNCHRRIITDHLLAAGEDVRHILGPNRITTAEMTPFAVESSSQAVTYPGAHQSDLFTP
jgi:uncharacterized protein (DUF488 family)